jgi:Ca-activated chloride channel family protein
MPVELAATREESVEAAPSRPMRRVKMKKHAQLRAAPPPPSPVRPGPPPGGEAPPPGGFQTEAYDRIYENPFMLAQQNPLSTFSIDVDTASYSNMRRILNQGQMPPKGAIRIEELVNYFTYDYPKPKSATPFSVNVEIAGCPWNEHHRIARIGLKGRQIDRGQRSSSNLVFLLDVSGSMNNPNKLPLLKKALKMLINNLNKKDRVAIVVYAGASGLALPSTSAAKGNTILEALDNLRAGGSTNAGQGIELAYDVAQKNFIDRGINRVILATDGDFNVGITNQSDLIRLVEKKAKKGVFLTVLGFGMGNYKDSTLEKLADKGNGNYGYIDTEKEARKILVEQMGGTLVTIAKDVKIQVELNPARVGAYRLIGYENRMLKAEDFKDDSKDAGEIGAGHTVTALYELVPPDRVDEIRKTDALKYQRPATVTGGSKELMTVKLRYKKPDEDESRPIEFPIVDQGQSLRAASADFKFAAAVAGFGMLLRDSEHKGDASYDSILALAKKGTANDRGGYRAEFLEIVEKAKELAGK